MGELFIKLEKLQNISGTNDKKKFIKNNQDDQLFLDTLEFLLNPYKITNISKKKINKKVRVIDNQLKDLNEFYDYLIKQCTGKDRDIAIIQAFIREHGEFREQLEELACKSMRLGVQGKLVNQALGYEFIPTHDVMLAGKYEGKLKELVSISLKLDGIRCSICTINGITKALTRQGKEITGIDYILEEYKKLKLTNYFVDGELIKVNREMLPSDENFRLTTKIVNSKSPSKEGLEFVVFDMTTMKEYNNKRGNLTYFDRMKLMDEYIGEKGNCIRLVPKYGITDKVEEIEDKLNQVVNRGQEGLILNTLSGKYEFGKRPKSLLKVKKFSEADVLCVGINEGQGQLKGATGALVCKFLYKGEECDVEVGTGLSSSDRRTIFNNPDLVVGKVITIKYFEVSKDSKTGKYSLRFPSWKGMVYIRKDKSTLEETNI